MFKKLKSILNAPATAAEALKKANIALQLLNYVPKDTSIKTDYVPGAGANISVKTDKIGGQENENK